MRTIYAMSAANVLKCVAIVTTNARTAEKKQMSSARAVGKYAQNVLRMSFAPIAATCAKNVPNLLATGATPASSVIAAK